MYSLCVCAIFKNEAHILDEWIRHYLDRGVDHIFLVNDFSNDNFQEIIDRFGSKITLSHNDIVTYNLGRQTMIYEKYFRPILNTTKWAAILDLDEFLYSPETTDLLSIIERYNDYSQLKIDWLHFGSSDHIYQPQSVVEGFRMRADFDTTKPYYGFKSILKADCIQGFSIHSHYMTGNSVHISYSENAPLIINHYPIQSLTFFTNVKSARGDDNNYNQTSGRSRNIEYFNSHDTNNIEDNRLYLQNKNTIECIKYDKLSITNDVVLAITSCNRPHLLERTLESFVKYNTYSIKETYIADDSGKVGCNDEVISKYKDILNIKPIYNKKNIGQVKSIDRMYSYITTKWIFHCEEDWEFLQPSFIEKSMKVFNENPHEKLFTVWLRPHNCTSRHPIKYDSLNRGYYEMMRDYSYMWDDKLIIWGGITFNPGLRRTDVCLKYHPYYEKCDKLYRKGKYYEDEYMINDKYRIDGYYSYILDSPSGHVTHIGWNDHVMKDLDYVY